MNKLIINADQGRHRISRHIYGHFSEHLGRCIYGGFWVGEESPIPNTRGIRNDIVAALRKIKTPNVRWPGGCFADTYHWMDGIGPRAKRPTMINTHWGGVTENNHFGTHEFMDLCGQLECEAYICGNLGSGTVQEMAQWVEYLTFEGKSPMADLRAANGRKAPWKVPFWGVGNENWGCGGNMRPEYYADEYKRYNTFCRDFGGNKLFRVACGPVGASYDWTEVLMKQAGTQMQGLALHYYTNAGPWHNKGSATAFDEAAWIVTMENALGMQYLVDRHSTIMDKYDPEKKVALVVDEWGTWYDCEPGTNPAFLYQQNTLRDALVAGLTLNIFNNRCDRVRLANIAQTINVLQAMILTEGEKMILTPTYHVFDMYAVHQDAIMLPVTVENASHIKDRKSLPQVSASASRDKAGVHHVTLCNIDPQDDANLSCAIHGIDVSRVKGRVLTSDKMNAHNTFDKPETLAPAVFKGARIRNGNLSMKLPAKSVVVLELG